MFFGYLLDSRAGIEAGVDDDYVVPLPYNNGKSTERSHSTHCIARDQHKSHRSSN